MFPKQEHIISSIWSLVKDENLTPRRFWYAQLCWYQAGLHEGAEKHDACEALEHFVSSANQKTKEEHMKFVKCFCVCLTDLFAIVFDSHAKTSESRITFCRSFFHIFLVCLMCSLSLTLGTPVHSIAELRCVVHKVQLWSCAKLWSCPSQHPYLIHGCFFFVGCVLLSYFFHIIPWVSLKLSIWNVIWWLSFQPIPRPSPIIRRWGHACKSANRILQGCMLKSRKQNSSLGCFFFQWRMFFFLSYYFYPYGPEFILGSFHTLGEGQNDFERPYFLSQLSDYSKLFQVEFPNVGTASLAWCPGDFEGSVQKIRAGWAAGNWFRRSEMTQPLSHPFHDHGSVKKWVT